MIYTFVENHPYIAYLLLLLFASVMCAVGMAYSNDHPEDYTKEEWEGLSFSKRLSTTWYIFPAIMGVAHLLAGIPLGIYWAAVAEWAPGRSVAGVTHAFIENRPYVALIILLFLSSVLCAIGMAFSNDPAPDCPKEEWEALSFLKRLAKTWYAFPLVIAFLLLVVGTPFGIYWAVEYATGSSAFGMFAIAGVGLVARAVLWPDKKDWLGIQYKS